MAYLHLSVMCSGGQRCLISLSEPKGSSVPSVALPGSMVVLACCDDHKEVKGFLLRRVSWGFSSYLMRSGDARCVMATWRVLSGGFNAPLYVTLEFPAVFFFFKFCVLSFLKLPSFPLSSSFFTFFRCYCCSVFSPNSLRFPAFCFSLGLRF